MAVIVLAAPVRPAVLPALVLPALVLPAPVLPGLVLPAPVLPGLVLPAQVLAETLATRMSRRPPAGLRAGGPAVPGDRPGLAMAGRGDRFAGRAPSGG